MFLNYINWDIAPEIFSIGDFGIRWYSLLFGLGIFLSYLIMSQIYKKEGLKIELLDSLSVYVILGTVLGARLGHCLFYETAYYFEHPLEMILPWKGSIFGDDFHFTGFRGLASHGGGIGILFALFLYAKKFKLNYLWILDRIVIVVALSGASIRLGNLMNSEIIGIPTDLPFGFIFERIDNIPRHPTQLYEAFAYILIFLALFFYYRKFSKTFRQGNILAYFLISLFPVRFILEFFKENQEVFEENLVFNMGQLLSIPFILFGVFILVRNYIIKIENK